MIENFEQAIAQQVFSKQQEKTFIDKILAKQDIEGVRELIKKPRLKREELLELLYLLTSTESKLLNYGEWDRYIILKYFVWVREFIKISELLFDYKEYLEAQEKKDEGSILEQMYKFITSDDEKAPKIDEALKKQNIKVIQNFNAMIEAEFGAN